MLQAWPHGERLPHQTCYPTGYGVVVSTDQLMDCRSVSSSLDDGDPLKNTKYTINPMIAATSTPTATEFFASLLMIALVLCFPFIA